jgi:hypothetical protein
MRLASALLLLSIISAPVRGDFVTLSPASIQGAQALTSPITGTTYTGSSGDTIGYGSGLTQLHDVVSAMTFDLSHVQGTIVGLTLTGSVPTLTSLSGQTYFPNQYAQLGVSLTLPGSLPNPSDPQALYNAVTTGQNVGGFTVDNGLILPPVIISSYGSSFNVSLGASAISAAQTGSLALGFAPQSATPFTPGVMGDLSNTQLVVETVPEPSAVVLLGIGLVTMLCATRSLKRLNAGNPRVLPATS